MHCTMSGNRGDTTQTIGSSLSTLFPKRRQRDALSFPMVIFATIFFNAVFFLKKPLSRLSFACRSSSRSSCVLPRAFT